MRRNHRCVAGHPGAYHPPGLHEAERPVSESKGWHKPKVVVARDPGDAARRDALQAAAPGAKADIRRYDNAAAASAAANADVIIGFCTPELLARAKRVQWIQMLSAGVERCVGIPAVGERGLLVTNMQRVAGPVMAEHVLAMMFALARDLPAYISAQGSGRWEREPRGAIRAVSLEGKTMLIAGLGGIGVEVAQRAHAIGMRVIATRASGREGPDFVSYVGLPDEMLKLLPEADVVVDTLPLTEQTRQTFDARSFAAMKSGAYFINVGRGGTVVTADLVNALKENHLGGAGLDVTDPGTIAAGSSRYGTCPTSSSHRMFQQNLNSKRTGTGRSHAKICAAMRLASACYRSWT